MTLRDNREKMKFIDGYGPGETWAYFESDVEKAVMNFEKSLKYYFEGKMKNYWDKDTKDLMINLHNKYLEIFGEFK